MTHRTCDWTRGSPPRRPAFRAGALGALALTVLAAACDSSPTASNGNGHVDATRMELHTRGAAGGLLATWTDGEGWTDAQGNAITELPNPVPQEGGALAPLRARGQNASLTVKFFYPDGSEVTKGTVSRDDVTRERQCTEFSARYFLPSNDAEALAWPNQPHPDAPNGSWQFATRGNDDLVGIFHCDHIHFYPENAGTATVEFLLWHIDHADERTDPITIRVEEGPAPIGFEIETRGAVRHLLGRWNAWDGWTDAAGDAITRIEAPREVEGGALVPLVAGGPNVSLTIRYLEWGEVVPFATVERQDEQPRERICSDIYGRYAVDGAGGVLAWPPQSHPDGAHGQEHFAVRSVGGAPVAIFHCDHLHLYPEAAGEAGVRFVAWDRLGGEPVASSGPLTFVVQPAD